MMDRAQKRRKMALGVLKIGLSALFVVVILRFVRVADIANHFTSLDPWYTFLLFPISFVAIGVSCIKWRMLLGERRHDVPLRSLFGLYLVGYFFSNFLPSMVGGDAVRGYLLGRRLESFKASYLSVLIERLTGLFALIVMVGLLALSNHRVVQAGRMRVTLLLVAGGLISVLLVLGSRRLFKRGLALLPARLARVRTKIDKAHHALLSFRQERNHFVGVMLLSLSFHILTGINVYCACRALNCPVSLLDLILVTPLIILVSLLPLSMNGIGLWEGSFVVILGLVGVPQSIAVSAALLLRCKTLIVSALGWGVYFNYRHQPGGATMGHDIASLRGVDEQD
ncbi:MAG: flippase-like domain-containing protein [Verrucomicrobia bacterium]|jgi:glycosyltransferase 2 family protein|nr:flippase-like domain-containing protein [Verrucomicrobiota bacterium]MBT7066087.1 flippase-like domain-containing protein [Verrucomicrobiota bacterium]MBT7700297.1 flippase-like domain-containing protein [Verrucomicrobiota bacterium]